MSLPLYTPPTGSVAQPSSVPMMDPQQPPVDFLSGYGGQTAGAPLSGYQAGVAFTPDLLAQQQGSFADRMATLQSSGWGGPVAGGGISDSYMPQPTMGGQQYQIGGQQQAPWLMSGGQQGVSPYGPPPWAQASWMQQQQPPMQYNNQPPQGPTLQNMPPPAMRMQRSPLDQVRQQMVDLKSRSNTMNPQAFSSQMRQLYNKSRFTPPPQQVQTQQKPVQQSVSGAMPTPNNMASTGQSTMAAGFGNILPLG